LFIWLLDKLMRSNDDLTVNDLFMAIKNGDHPLPPAPGQFDATSVMALFLFDPEIRLLFVQKADVKGYTWANQMAFPGGHQDPLDISSEQTALRELKEEMNISPSNVQVIGSLGHYQTLNNKDIEAWAGIWNQKDKIVIDPEEISRVFKIPLSDLIHCHIENEFHVRQVNFMQLIYPYNDVRIWGVTAKIVCHLLELILKSAGEPPH
jgi:coenzyme A diphosphatase NUDT7